MMKIQLYQVMKILNKRSVTAVLFYNQQYNRLEINLSIICMMVLLVLKY
jgi:hypothetical protein